MRDRIKYFFPWACVAIFLTLKLTQLTYRFGDGNAYFYMAKMVVDGKIPYRDFFLADPPVLVLVLSVFRFVFGNTVLIYQALPYFFEAGSAILLSLLLKQRKNNLAYVSSLLYLFSFTILSTSDFFTGVQLTVVLFLAGVYFSERKQLVVGGIFFALSSLTKLYALPLVAGYLGYEVLRSTLNYKTGNALKATPLKGVLGFVCAGVIVLLPFFILAPKEMINNLIIHQLHRPEGLDKWSVLSFFFGKEWWIIIFGLLGLRFIPGRFIVSFLTGAVFLIIFKDLYYVYLAVLMPFLVAGSLAWTAWLFGQGENGKRFAGLTILVYCVFLFFSASSYFSDFALRGKFTNAQEIGDFTRTLPDHPLYGSHEVAPLVSLLSNKSLFNNYIDTNGQVFASGAFNLEKVSRDAVAHGVYLIGRITDRPDLGIAESGYEGYFRKNEFEMYCKRKKLFRSTSNEQDTSIGIYYCKN